MTVRIGIDFMPGQWRVCCLVQEQPEERSLFASAEEMLARIRQICTQYPEPTIVISLDVATPFVMLASLNDEQLEQLVQCYHPAPAYSEATGALRALRALSLHSYCAPSVEYLPTVPLHRTLMHPALGSARQICAVVTLLHHMREQQAMWGEMSFFYVNTGENGTCVLTLINGQVVNGIDRLRGSSLPATYNYLATLEGAGELEEKERVRRDTLQAAARAAFWEGLTQELAGLLAVHHIEDMVVLGQQSEEVIERLAETYQVYLFPYTHTEREGYESALGAALLAEGLEQEGQAALVVNHLQLRQAVRELLISSPQSISANPSEAAPIQR